MSNVHEALKQAIEQLEVSWTICTDEDYMEGFRNAANLCKAALAELDKCEPELYMAKNLHNKSYATSHSEAEARLFLLQSGLKVDGIESEVIPLCRCNTSPQPRDWVNLTDMQISNIGVQHQSLHQVAYAISDALKQLNTKG